jgi:dihydrofolate synthase/folylpolyglutamate synthase
MTSPAAAALAGLPRFPAPVGLHRIHWLVRQCEAAFGPGPECIKIVGSKGKGSVAALLHAIVQQLEPCGVYTSPHLTHVEERFRIGSALVDAATLLESFDWVARAFARRPEWMSGEQLGFFETATAAAWYLFTRSRLRVAIVEAGLGGRLDATRVLPGRLAGLTSVELEHAAILGPTPEHIAYDKIEIAPAGGLVLAGDLEAGLRHRLAAYAGIAGVRLAWSDDRVAVTASSCTRDGSRVNLRLEGADEIEDVWIALAGRHQIANAALAVALAYEWARRRYTSEDFVRAVRDGLAAVAWPCRFERVHTGPDVFIDVCHTPASARACAASVRELLAGDTILLVTGGSYDKHVEEIVDTLAAEADAIICTRAHHKGADVERVAAVVERRRPDARVDSAGTVDEAIALAMERARRDGLTVVVAGGLFLAAEARAVLRGEDPRAIQFA